MRAAHRPEAPDRLLLMGNPNVGKSAVFSRLTGADVIASNYPGTTVGFAEGKLMLQGQGCLVIDVPGIYTLEPVSRAEDVAVEMLRKGGVVINVVDATNLERNLNLTLQLLSRNVPMVVALNMWDETEEHGIFIDVEKLQEQLGVPVVPTCAISGEGMKELLDAVRRARPGELQYDSETKWELIGGIVERVQRVEHRHPTLGQTFSHATVHPAVGPLIALAILFVSFEVVRIVGESLIGYVADPFFDRFWAPVVEKLSATLGGGGFLHALLIGDLVAGEIDMGASFGLLTTALYVPLAQVLPYVFSFYIVLCILEDSGYLPRLGVLVDNLMHRLGLHGLSIVPLMLGLGCAVPGMLALRVLETRKERFIAATLLGICVPCMAQTAMIVGLLGKYGAGGLLPVFGTLFVLLIVMGMILKRFTRGITPEIIVDIPPYRIPYWKSLVKKLWMRMRGFVKEALPFVFLGVLLINVLYATHVIDVLGNLFKPVMTRLLGLPKEAVAPLIIGFLRKDVAVGALKPLGLSMRQLIVACVVLTVYFPCAATFIVMLRELGWKDMLKASAIMLMTALAVGTLMNLILTALRVAAAV